MPALHRRAAFTLIDLMIAVMMLLLLGTLVLAAVSKTAYQAPRVACASNLRQIGQGLALYANENGGHWPRTYWNGSGMPLNAYTNWQATEPFSIQGPRENDITAGLFLVLRTQNMTSEVFICPTNQMNEDVVPWDFGASTAANRSNFPSRRHLSYSYANPYPSAEASQRQYDLSKSLPANFAVAADMNSGAVELFTIVRESAEEEMQKVNSRNHQGAGQNVLYGDGHVSWQAHPFVGIGGDNIYTYIDKAQGVGIVGSSAGPSDSILLPTALFGPQPLPMPVRSNADRFGTILLVAGAIGALLVVLAVAGTGAAMLLRRSRTHA